MAFANLGVLVIEAYGRFFPLGMVKNFQTDETESEVKYLIKFGDLQQEASYLKWLELAIGYGVINLKGKAWPFDRPEYLNFSLHKNKKIYFEVNDCFISTVPMTIDQIRDLNFIELEFVKEKEVEHVTP